MRKPNLILFVSWLVSAVTIIAVSMVINPDMITDNGFLGRVLWTEILNIIIWYGATGWFAIDNKQSSFAITPANSFLSLLYCIISFGLMLINSAHQYENIFFVRNYMIFQIVLTAIYVLVSLRISLALHFANTDMVITVKNIKSPNQLAGDIKTIELSAQTTELKKSLKTLREKIEHSLRYTNKTLSNSDYHAFVGNVSNVLTLAEQNKDISDKIRKLLNDIDIISSKLKVI